MDLFEKLSGKIRKKTAKIGILGMGYVGSAIAEATSDGRFNTIGFEIDQKKIDFVTNQGKKYLTATGSMSRLSTCDIICICVPTPLLPDRIPDLRFLTKAVETISLYMRDGQLIILESSVAPGTTRNILLPALQNAKRQVGKNFFLGFSPERIDPGNKKYTMTNIPKVVSGIDEKSAQLVHQFYASFVKEVIPVSSPETAEMTKILENLFRLVNISLINELMSYTIASGINLWEVIAAASTKPFGFLPHYPSAGAGGYCIPVLPRYLLSDAKKKDVLLPLVQTALEINEKRPKHVVSKAVKLLNGIKEKKTPKVLLVGVSYKEGNTDIRESTAIKVWEVAKEHGLDVSYHDPHVPRINGHASVDLTPAVLDDHDLIIITTAHKNIAYETIVSSNKLIVDTRNVLKGYTQENIVRL